MSGTMLWRECASLCPARRGRIRRYCSTLRRSRAYQRISGQGRTAVAPLDVLIRRVPKLQIRQPDVLFITNKALAQGGGIPQKGPLTVAPELVVEILSDSGRQNVIDEKLADYCVIGVQEAWLVRPAEKTVEGLRLSPTGSISTGTYSETQTFVSLTFSDWTVTIADFFKP